LKLRELEQPLQTKVSLLIIDRKYSLVVEVREEQDNNNNKNNAISQSLIKIGLATYSNSKLTDYHIFQFLRASGGKIKYTNS
jgi:hypothetical protein